MAANKSIPQLAIEFNVAKISVSKQVNGYKEEYNINRVIGYRAMRIFIKCYEYEVSNTTMHKYMNKELNLCAVITHSKPDYKVGKKNNILTIS